MLLCEVFPKKIYDFPFQEDEITHVHICSDNFQGRNSVAWSWTEADLSMELT